MNQEITPEPPSPQVVTSPFEAVVEPEVVAVAPEPEENRANEHGYMKEVITEEVPAAVVEPEVVYVPPTPAPVEEPKSKNLPSKLSGTKRVVRLSKLVFESKERNSASVGLVQYRLVERGHYDAGSDKYGWLSVGTRKALASFAGTNAEKLNLQDKALIERLFEGTDVEVID